MTLWQFHVDKWNSCTICPLSQGRSRVVLGKGKVPCDVLFVGEAPGESEDAIGIPFIGPAGKVLDRIIANAGILTRSPPLRCAFTNLVCCIPRSEVDGSKTSQPLPEHIKACSQRLQEFVYLAAPNLIVCIGVVAQQWLDPTDRYRFRIKVGDESNRERINSLEDDSIPSISFVSIIHPAAILRANVAQQGFLEQRAVIQLADAVEEVF